MWNHADHREAVSLKSRSRWPGNGTSTRPSEQRVVQRSDPESSRGDAQKTTKENTYSMVFLDEQYIFVLIWILHFIVGNQRVMILWFQDLRFAIH